MPRTIDPFLLQALDRANPNVAHFVEINAPDVANVLRRSDQFLAPVSQTPANSIVADPAGALTIAATPAGATIASFAHTDDYVVAVPHVGLGFHSGHQTEVRALCWLVDQSFGRGALQSVAIPIRRKANTVQNNLLLYIYRRRGTSPGISVFEPVLSAPARWLNTVAQWPGGGNDTTAVFDFNDQDVELGMSNVPPITAAGVGEEQAYYFVLEVENAHGDDLFNWPRDLTSARTVAGIGTFVDRRWYIDDGNTDGGWSLDAAIPASPRVPCATIVIRAYPATAQAVYALDLGGTPAAASSGRVVFERGAPIGTSATLELSTAGSGGPWTAVTDGDAVVTRQQTYHVRATLSASANGRVAPKIAAMGVEFLIATDATAEAIVEPIVQQIDVPFLAAGIGEGSVTILRTGRRDHRDVGSELASQNAVSKLEAIVRLGSRHPLVTRDKWLLIDRALVNNRAPTATGEQLNLLSYLKLLKQKIPQRSETINTVHTVTSATVAAVAVTPALPAIGGTNAVGAYDGKNAYLRVRSSSQSGVRTGFVQTIDGNTDANTLFFGSALPGTLIAGDVVEVHSGQFAQNPIVWQDADPADVWWELLTVHCAVPTERIGRAELGTAGRSGLPPRVSDRAPEDAATQAKLTVTLKLTDAEEASGLIDQLSFIMGGATVEIAGQICFRQIYPLRDPSGDIVVAPEPIAAVFDVRNTTGPDTPVGLEQRIAALGCAYGVNRTAVSSDTPAALTTEFADVDALAWLSTQPVDELADAAVPDEIARWCYNSADDGLYLASMLTQQVVRAASTGLRVWTWTATELQPQLVVGDRVVVITDQYTDYDPAAQRAIRGWWAFPLVLVSVAGGGRQFRGYMLGLTEAVQIRGGAGTLALDPFAENVNAILRITDTESSDGTLAQLALIVGVGVDHVEAYYRTVPVDTDPKLAADFSNTATLKIDGERFARPDPDRAISFAFPQPTRGNELLVRLVSFYFGDGIYIPGASVVFPVTAAPPSIDFDVTATKSGNLASVSAKLSVGPSDVPGTLALIETVLGVDTTLVTVRNVTGTVTFDPASYAMLASRPIPAGAESVKWRLDFTDVSGQVWSSGEISALPALAIGTVAATEDPAARTATLIATMIDSGNYLNPAAKDVLNPAIVGALTAHTTLRGVTQAIACTSIPVSGTSGDYRFVIPIDPTRPIMVTIYRHYVDGSTDVLWANAIDSNKISDVENVVPTNNGTTANVFVQFDNDTAIGAGGAQYSLNGGSTWTPFAVAGDYTALITGVARTTSVQSMIIQGKNAIDGLWGNSTTIPIDPYTADVPSLTAQYKPLTATTGQIIWTCTLGVVTLSIDGGTPGTPAASPIPITLDGSTHDYAFVATLGSQTVSRGVSVPALPPSALPIVYLWNSAQSTTADTITMSWTVTNTPASPTYDLLWSNDRGATITTISGVTSPYVHTKLGTGGHGYDIVAGGTITTLQYAIVVKDSGVKVAQSAWRDVDVDHA